MWQDKLERKTACNKNGKRFGDIHKHTHIKIIKRPLENLDFLKNLQVFKLIFVLLTCLSNLKHKCYQLEHCYKDKKLPFFQMCIFNI